MDTVSVFAIAFAIGVIAGLRSLTAPAVVSWAAYLGWFNVQDTWAAFLGHTASVYIFTALALVELVSDKLPKTPSRKTPAPFTARIVLGAACGAALCAAGRQPSLIGAGPHTLRRRLKGAGFRDRSDRGCHRGRGRLSPRVAHIIWYRVYNFAFLLVISAAALNELTSESPAEIHKIAR